MTRVFIYLSLIATLVVSRSAAQYAPQVPLDGNEGIADTSNLFRDWASGCTLYRGWLDIADTSLGKPTVGAESNVYGQPGTGLLSLGDSGVAVLTFNYPVFNGAGPDFAVFENAFADPLNDTMAFLELAFVEVSSDGIHFFRFPASSLMQDTLQIDNFSYSDTRYYHNLAGKYLSGYGTPFDLEELKDIPGLDVDQITHIRIVDVIGSINPLYASLDKDGHIINDPYPSVYPSGGFDLRGIGIINSTKPPTAIGELTGGSVLKLYPNPVREMLYLETSTPGIVNFTITDLAGKKVKKGSFTRTTGIPVQNCIPGLYLICLDNGKEKWTLKFSKK